MIKVNITYKDNQISAISLDGHADFADVGQDLVCAGVSTCFLGSLNAIKNKDNIKYSYSKGKGYIKVVKKLDNYDSTVLDVMISQLEFVSENYPNNVKVIKN